MRVEFFHADRQTDIRHTDRQTDVKKRVVAFQNFVKAHKMCNVTIIIITKIIRPPLWSSGQGFWLQIQRSRV